MSRQRGAFSFHRFLVVVVLLASWLVMTNHCALARLRQAPAAEENVPPCHKSEHAPNKGIPCHEMTQCCMSVKASVADKVGAKFDSSKFQLQAFAVLQEELARAGQPVSSVDLDHGPPATVSFAELVLQRSVLSHAPPYGI